MATRQALAALAAHIAPASGGNQLWTPHPPQVHGLDMAWLVADEAKSLFKQVQ